MINLNEMEITDVQFFNQSHEEQINENGNVIEVLAYSCNVVFDSKLVVQLSGNEDEAHAVYIPSANECYFNDEEFQKLAYETLGPYEVQDRLDELGFENNFHFLNENATEKF